MRASVHLIALLFYRLRIFRQILKFSFRLEYGSCLSLQILVDSLVKVLFNVSSKSSVISFTTIFPFEILSNCVLQKGHEVTSILLLFLMLLLSVFLLCFWILLPESFH